MKRAVFLLCFTAICASAAQAATVSGKVFLGATTSPGYPATVYLVKKSFDASLGCSVLTLIDSATTASNGEYHFYSVTTGAGDLLVKAALTTANPSYASYVPTYKENSLLWSGGHAVSFTLGANNIHMVAGTNPGGPGFIGGSVLAGANKSTAAGDPLAGKEMIITTAADEVIAYTYSDASGHFAFEGLPYGTYKLFGDDPGKDCSTPLILTISADNASVTSVVFKENKLNFTGSLALATPAVVQHSHDFVLSPCPVTNSAVISGFGTVAGEKQVVVRSITGAKLISAQIADGATGLQLNVSDLSAGLYFVTIQCPSSTVTLRMLK